MKKRKRGKFYIILLHQRKRLKFQKHSSIKDDKRTLNGFELFIKFAKFIISPYVQRYLRDMVA